jgi:hypothetical protein
MRNPRLPGFNAEIAFYRTTNHYGLVAIAANRSGGEGLIPQLPWSRGCVKAQAAADAVCLAAGGLACSIAQSVADKYC